MNDNETRWTGSSWDPWPLIRLLTVFAALGLWAHWHLAVNLPTLPALGQAVLGLFEVFCLCALLSYGAAQLYLVVLLFPVYAAILLNDWFYDGSHWLLRLLPGPRSPRLNAGLALAGELGLFLSLGRGIEILLRTYGH